MAHFTTFPPVFLNNWILLKALYNKNNKQTRNNYPRAQLPEFKHASLFPA